MRIAKVHVGSFGRMKDRDFDMSGDMTVVHGPNESGKTTLMEFIRNTLVPTPARNVYPERNRTDSGSVFLEDGGEVTLESRTRGGDVPGRLEDMDPELYRSVFALGAKDLDDEKVLESGEVGQRFLTIPGSEGFPEAMEEAERRTSGLLGKTSSSPSQLAGIEKELADTGFRITQLKANAESYGMLTDRISELRSRLAALREGSSGDRERHDTFVRYQSQAANYADLEEARRLRGEVGPFNRVTDEGLARYSQLSSERAAAKQTLDSDLAGSRACRDSLNGADPGRVDELSPRIGKAASDLSLYRSLKSSAEAPRRVTSTVSKPDTVLVAVGAVLVLAGAAGALFSVYALALAGIGAAVAVLGFVRRKQVTVTTETQCDPEPARKASEYEREVEDMMAILGQEHISVESDVARLESLVSSVRAYRTAEARVLESRSAFNAADTRFMKFMMPFGSESRFRESAERTKQADRLDSRIEQLTAAIVNSGLDPDVPVCPVEDVLLDGAEENGIAQEIGRLEEQRRAVLDTSELDALLDRRAALEAGRSEVLRAGAVSFLSSFIAEEACGDAYEKVHPGVMNTADRYLSMMTCGRYRFDMDPRRKGLRVVDGDNPKTLKQCSTGLRAQALLSIKLAIAKELGGGEVPVILDDVTLPFDTERKRGALGALAQVAGEMQVLLFTCDDQTAELASGFPGVRVTEL